MFKKIVSFIVEKRVLYLLEQIEEISEKLAEKTHDLSVSNLANPDMEKNDKIKITKMSNEVSLINIIFASLKP